MIQQTNNLDKQLDFAWSLLVKLRAGNFCEFCGTPHQLNSHHIFSRRHKATRWKVSNGMALCVPHHVASYEFSAHNTPIIFNDWLRKKKGNDFLNGLYVESREISKITDLDKKDILKELNNQIKKHQNER